MSRYIGSPEWIASNTGKLGLRRIGGVMLNWSVIDHTGRILPKGDYIARFDTHAEAITYAQEHAKTQAIQAEQADENRTSSPIIKLFRIPTTKSHNIPKNVTMIHGIT